MNKPTSAYTRRTRLKPSTGAGYTQKADNATGVGVSLCVVISKREREREREECYLTLKASTGAALAGGRWLSALSAPSNGGATA